MKTVFINLSLRPGAKRRLLPVGLAYVMTAAKKSGFDFDLIDMDVNELSLKDLEEILSRKIYDVYAFGCIVTGFKTVKNLSRIIKKMNPKGVIIAGNSVATSIPEILLSNTMVDIAVLGEGDVTIVELLQALENGSSYFDVKGIAFRPNGKIVFTNGREISPDLDYFDFPDWDIFDLDKYLEFADANSNAPELDSLVPYPLNTSRGCPYSCTFCYHAFKGKKYRRYSDKAILGEINRLSRNYKSNFISFWDELTFPSVKKVRSLTNSISKLNYTIKWDAPCRAGLFKKEDIGLIRDMKESGCDNISFSLENADPGILAAMGKNITVNQFTEQAEALWEGGVTPLTSVIFGYPQETPESIQATIDVCEQCNIFPSVGFLLPLPGTPIYDWTKKNGYIDDEIEYLERIGDRQDFHINLTKMADDEFMDIVRTKLEFLAGKMGFDLESVFKTTTYQKPVRTGDN